MGEEESIPLLFGVRFTGANVQKWPFPAAQAMKFTRGRPTAACDPKQPFAHETSEVRFGGLAGPTNTSNTVPFSELLFTSSLFNLDTISLPRCNVTAAHIRSRILIRHTHKTLSWNIS